MSITKKLIFITGGARSGKSRYAQELALQAGGEPVYLATARRWDEDFGSRIERHRQDRDARWKTLEVEKELGSADLGGKVVVIDCITLWLANYFTDLDGDENAVLESCTKELDLLFRQEAMLILISNEIGMGLHAETTLGRKFTDLQGWINQYIAARADQAIFMVSGLPLVIKNNHP